MTRPALAPPPPPARHGPWDRGLRGAWYRLVALSLNLLYDRFAWAYDAVSWTVSLGRWRAWQQTCLQFLPPEGSVLELASGPGHLLVALRQARLSAFGLDISRGMLRLARRRLHKHHLPLALCQGHAAVLPFASGSFDALVVTFPTAIIYEAVTNREIARVLKPLGTLVIVEQAWFPSHRPTHRVLEWLYRITGQRGPAPDLTAILWRAGLLVERLTVAVQGTVVGLIIAQKLPPPHATTPSAPEWCAAS